MVEMTDISLWMMFLTELLSNEPERERVIAEIAAETGMSCEKVESFLYALYEQLAKQFPDH
jgi:predicted nuclease of restriction endonuclease-like RecB superfamily